MTSMPREPAVDGTTELGIRALGRASLGYAFGGLAYKAVALVSVPVLARLLTPAQLGLLDVAAILATLVGLTAAMGADQAVPYFRDRLARGGEAWAAVIVVVAATAGMLMSLVVLLRAPIASVLVGDVAQAPAVAAAGLYGAVTSVSALALLALRLESSVRAYALVSFVLVTTEMSAALLVAWLVPNPVPWMILAWAAGALLVTIPVLMAYLPRPDAWPSRASVLRVVRFGAPLVPAVVAWLAGDAWIRSALARDASLEALGAYGIAHRVASVMALGVTGIGVAWQPYLYGSAEPDVEARTARVAAPLILVLAAFGVALTLLGPEVVAVAAGPAYAAATEGIPALCAGMVALGTFVLVTPLIGRSGSTRRIGLAALAGTGVQAVAATLLVPQLGVLGAALASAVGYAAAAAWLTAEAAASISGATVARIAFASAFAFAGLAGAGILVDQSLTLRIGGLVLYAALALGLGQLLRSPRSVPAP